MLRSFGQVRDLIKLDEKQLESGYEFLLSRQAENGSFTEEGEFFYGSQRSALTMTANVLLALLEQQKPNQTAIDKAVAYLNAHPMRRIRKIYCPGLLLRTLCRKQSLQMPPSMWLL